MATDKKIIELDIQIETAQSLTKVGDIRKAIKDLTSEANAFGEGEGFIKASQAAGALKDKLEDTKDSIKSFSNSPIENLNNSFSSLGQKIKSLDIKGAKQQFSNFSTSLGTVAKGFLGIEEGAGFASIGIKGIGKAIAATGIGLLIIAIVTLITNFDKLKEAGGALAKVFDFVTGTITKIKDAFFALTDALHLTDIANQKLAENTAKNNKKINDSYQDSLDFQVTYLKAQGKNADEAERKAQAQREQSARQNIIDLKAQGKLEGEERDKAFAELKKQKENSIILDATLTKKATDEAKKAADDATKEAVDDSKKAEAARKVTLQKRIQDLKDSNELAIKQTKDGSIEELKAREEGNRKLIQFYNDNQTKLIQLGIITEGQRKIIIQDANDNSLKANKEYYDKLDKSCQDGEDKITATKKAALDKQAADQAETDNKSIKAVQDNEKYQDDLGKNKILKAGNNQKEIAKIELDNLQIKIERYKNYSKEELDALGITEIERQNIIIESENLIAEKIKAIREKASDEFFSNITEKLNETASLLGGFKGSILEAFADVGNSFNEAFKIFTDDDSNLFDKISSGLELASSAVSAIGDVLQAKSEENIAQYDKERDNKIAALEAQKAAGLITEKQLADGKTAINADYAKKDLAARKKAFNIQKGIQITNAVIQTAQAVLAGFSSGLAVPIVGPAVGAAYAAIAGALGAVQIGLIASQKFDSGDGGGSAGITMPAINDAAIAAPSQASAAGPNDFSVFGTGGDANKLGAQSDITGANGGLRAYVVESDITSTQGRVKRYQENAEL